VPQMTVNGLQKFNIIVTKKIIFNPRYILGGNYCHQGFQWLLHLLLFANTLPFAANQALEGVTYTFNLQK